MCCRAAACRARLAPSAPPAHSGAQQSTRMWLRAPTCTQKHTTGPSHDCSCSGHGCVPRAGSDTRRWRTPFTCTSTHLQFQGEPDSAAARGGMTGGAASIKLAHDLSSAPTSTTSDTWRVGCPQCVMNPAHSERASGGSTNTMHLQRVSVPTHRWDDARATRLAGGPAGARPRVRWIDSSV